MNTANLASIDSHLYSHRKAFAMARPTTSLPTSPSRLRNGRALQDTTNVRFVQETETKAEVLDENSKVAVEAEECFEFPPESTGGQNVVDSPPINPNHEVLDEAVEVQDICEFPFESAASSTRQDAVNSSPDSLTEHITPLSEPSSLVLSSSSNVFLDQASRFKFAASTKEQDVANPSPIGPIEDDTPLPKPSPVELLSYSKKVPSQTSPSPTTKAPIQPSSPSEPSLPLATLPDLISVTLQDSEISSSPNPENTSVIFSNYERSTHPPLNPIFKTFRLNFGNLEDHTHTQDIIENARSRNCRWPIKQSIDPYDDESSDDEFSDENQPNNCEVLPSLNRAIFYTFLDIPGQLFDITSPPSPNGLPVVRSWTSDQLRDELGMYYASPWWINTCARAERWNPYPGVDMNRDWQRLYYKTADFFFTNESRIFREIEARQQEKRVRICESFARFSWKRQFGPLVFDIKWWCERKLDVVFEGDYGMHSRWSREPGSWWKASFREPLFDMPTTLPFLYAVEAEAKSIIAGVKREESMWDNHGPYISLQSKKRLYPEFESELEEIIELRAFGSKTTGFIELREDESLTELEFRGMKGKETPSVPRFKRQFKYYQKVFLSEKWKKQSEEWSEKRRVQEKKAGRSMHGTVSEEWRERRRAQEKKAGRWTDGTVRMNRMWEEYHWVCDDAGVMMVVQKSSR